ncbi:DUF4136 domain-containing protein [Fulvivirga ulvae]|uniref:DUF4136 domain-containing protein n=1 Tax=Fulvivirga ulvae TaxID=2904245 RepID=UPI001F45EA5E|nr:DUF4136 domain-containing protein [Fulvivirga ulvae]UII32624.1 DUF4136 domain-containing protein [Fulvivirga ulvae]
MRHLKILLTTLCIATISLSPSYSQDLVAMDERLDTSFEKYETFGWTSSAKSASAEDFLNDVALKSAIRDAIKYELDVRGYDMAGANPDLLINFKVFEKPTQFQGYTGHEEVLGNDEVREEEDFRTYNLKEGTLLIQMLDKEKGTIVWQGYASGIIDDDDMFDRDPVKIKDAVEQIFNRFEYKAGK